MKDVDIQARLFARIHGIERFLLQSFYTFWGRLKCRLMGVKLGRDVSFNGPIRIERFKHSRIEIGNNVTFNSNYVFNPRGSKTCILQTATDSAIIKIGDNCGLSGVSIVSWNSVKIHSHTMIGANVAIGDTDDHPERLYTESEPIEIGKNVFIGMASLIMKGVTIGENTVIGAGSVVTKKLPSNVLAAGVPCKVIRKNESL
jgi:acetyltransferase-like isoleucine patch superfamily enzyme